MPYKIIRDSSRFVHKRFRTRSCYAKLDRTIFHSSSLRSKVLTVELVDFISCRTDIIGKYNRIDKREASVIVIFIITKKDCRESAG